MAYSATGTDPTTTAHGGDIYQTYQISETEAGTATEYSIQVPVIGTITLFQATKTAGSASTLAPKAGLASGWSASTQNAVFARSAAAHHHDQDAVRYHAPGGVLYLRTTCDSGSDNSVSTRIIIRAGHGG